MDRDHEQNGNLEEDTLDGERRTVRILPNDSGDTAVRSYLPYDPQPARYPPTPSSGQQQPAQPIPIRRGPSACSVMVVTFGVLALACILLAFATVQGGLSGLGKLTGIVPSIGLPLRTPTVTIDTSRPSVVERVRALSKLETVHYEMEKVISGKSTGPLPDFFTSDRILLVAHGEVVGGVDFAKLSSQEIQVSDKSVTITMPNPEILYSKLDNERTYVYDRQTGLFNKPDRNLESQLRAVAEQEIVKAATEDGILLKAKENAKETLRTLLEGLGYEEIEIKEAP